MQGSGNHASRVRHLFETDAESEKHTSQVKPEATGNILKDTITPPGQRGTMACASVDMDIHGADEAPRRARQREPPMTRHYQALEHIPEKKGPLYDLLQKQPAVLGSVQIVSGLLSVGVGILFAVTQEMQHSLFSLFRVSQLSGALFIIAGLVSNLLFKYPGLLPVSLMVNWGCIIVAAVSACLISVDLAHWSHEDDQHLRMEVLELCVLVLEVSVSAVLCFWFSKEKHAKSP